MRVLLTSGVRAGVASRAILCECLYFFFYWGGRGACTKSASMVAKHRTEEKGTNGQREAATRCRLCRKCRGIGPVTRILLLALLAWREFAGVLLGEEQKLAVSWRLSVVRGFCCFPL